MAKELCLLTDKDLKTLPVSDDVIQEIVSIRELKAGAKKRQVKYLAKLLRQENLDELFLYISNKKGSKLHANKQLHVAERIRDTLINEAIETQEEYIREQLVFEPDWDSPYVDAAIEQYPNLNESELRKIIYQYAVTRNKQYYRELFRILKAAVELKDREKL